MDSIDSLALQPIQVEALLTISAMLNSDLNTGRVLRDLLLQISSLFQANRAAVFLREKLPMPTDKQTLSEALKEDVGIIICAASTNLTVQYTDALARYYEKHEFHDLQNAPEPIYIADAVRSHRLNGMREFTEREGFQTMLTLPLLYQGALIGTLILYHDQPHHYNEQETRLLTILANQAALAVTNARLYEMARSREREAAQLAEAGSVFNATLKTREVLNRVVRTVNAMLSNTVLIYIIQEDTTDAHPVAFYSKALHDGAIKVSSPLKAGISIAVGEGLIGKAMQNDVPFLMQNEADILKKFPFANELDPIKSLLCVPLKTRGRVIGALVAYQISYGQPVKTLDESHLRIARALADRAAAAIENARLYEAEKREQRVKDEFLSLVSHELNTPLTNIKGYNHLLARKLEQAMARGNNRTAEDLHHYTDVIGSQVDRLQRLVADLAKIHLIETNTLQLELTSTTLLPIIQAEVEQFQKQLHSPREAGIQHQFEIVANEPTLQALIEPEAFGRILQNLLSNAVKFSAKGSLITIELAKSSSKFAQITIKDQGIGISEQDLPLIFDRFYKGSSHPARASGLGLGLYISRNLALAMNGKLVATSVETQGSNFILQLPILSGTAALKIPSTAPHSNL